MSILARLQFPSRLREGSGVGARARSRPPLFRFGHGLDSATFEAGLPSLSAERVGADKSLTVDDTVVHVGNSSANLKTAKLEVV